MFEGRPSEVVCDLSGEPRPGAPAASRKPVLLVLHQQHSNPGHVGQWFWRNGYDLDICRHYDGAPLPATLDHHCGAIIFGGPQSANDPTDFIRREIEWIGVPLKERKPFLGICLGAQMLARHLGARVDHCTQGSVEVGYHAIHPTEAGRRLELPSRVYQWHREGFELPRGATLLAGSNGAYPNQAFRVDHAVGVQFHPEITYLQVNRWSGSSPIRLMMRGARPRQDHIDGHLTESPKVHRWLDSFLTLWVNSGCERV